MATTSMKPENSAPPADPQFDRLSIDGSDEFKTDTETSKYDEDFIRKWGFKLRDLYKMALMFYKEKEGKAVSLSYQDKLKLVALTKQVTIGKFNPDTCSPLGVLDVIGRDRRVAWQSLGDMSTEDTMVEFVELIDDRCPLFRPYAQAHRANMETRKAQEEANELKEAKEKEKQETENEATQTLLGLDEGDVNNMNVANLENHKRSIMEALNRQTYGQFKAYVEQHFPGDLVQQEQMMAQLQEQHYQQYIEQMMLRLKNTEQEEYLQYNGANGHIVYPAESEEEAPSSMSVKPASLWTRKDIREFKDSIRKEGGDSVIKVGHGETVTVRVPTNEEGTCLFWEFATDYYDIGFGVYFEWTKSPTNQVSVHVSESEDDEDYPNDDEDDDDDEDDEEFGLRTNDIERGMSKMNRYNLDPVRPPLTEILPVRRRDCMEQVYAGSHAYPGTGVYLLKFDNSYSLWRSKTLYYKVYYTR